MKKKKEKKKKKKKKKPVCILAYKMGTLDYV
jgi:hypothetical protein